MLKLALFVISVAAWSQMCEAGTVRRKRQADDYFFGSYDDMLPDGDYEFSGDLTDNLTLYFYITYEKPFDEELLIYGSDAFNAEARTIINLMESQIARNIGLIKDDITVEVLSFSSGSTKAEIAVKVPGLYDITEGELSEAVTDVKFENKVGSNPITKIEEIQLMPAKEEMTKTNIISLYLTYEYDSSSLDLSDIGSQAFANEEELLRQQVLLQLIEKLASQGIFVDDPDGLLIEIHSFESQGPNTLAIIEIETAIVTMDELSVALSDLVEDTEAPTDGRLIIAVEEISRSESYEYVDDMGDIMDELVPMDTKVMTGEEDDDYFHGMEMIPPSDDPVIEGEVMLPKDDDLNGEPGINGDDGDFGPVIPDLIVPEETINHEPTPPVATETPGGNERTPPEEVEPTPPEENESLPPAISEQLPPEVNEQLPPEISEQLPPEVNEPTPPDNNEVEPTPPSPSCTNLVIPDNGEMNCLFGNDIGSICHFTCDDDTRLEGENSIICQQNGFWSGEVPYCVRIYCQPHISSISDGLVACTNQNLFQSVCTFSCDEKHSLIGVTSTQCLKDSTWLSPSPYCVPDPINCDEEYGEWSACLGGQRVKESVTVSTSAETIVCPELKEACQDCVVVWSPWGDCDIYRKTRFQYVSIEPIGAGDECPPLEQQFTNCGNCVLFFGDWGPCVRGERKRTEMIHQQPYNGGKPCGEFETQTKECNECELTWGDWTECDGTKRTRTQHVSKQPVGVDDPCPELKNETEPCYDCISSWGPWSECLNGIRVRDLNIELEAVGAGEACRRTRQDMIDCCFFEQEEWSQCKDGERRRGYVLVTSPEDEVCEEPQEDVEDCQDCVLEWSDWGTECTDNKITSTQYVSQPQVGGGAACPDIHTLDERCANCEITWSGFGACIDGSSANIPEITVEPFGAGLPCPDVDTIYEVCSDCVVAWGDWSECSNGERSISEIIVVQPVGVGAACPELQTRTEACVDCLVDWRDWSACENGQRTRELYIKQDTVGAGKECPELELEGQDCFDCVVEWEEWSECADDVRSKKQFISVQPVGAGKACPNLETRVEACIDCVVEWNPWTDCFNDQRSREQVVVVNLVGAGAECPPLDSQTEECVVPGSKKALEKTICRFTDHLLGYKRRPVMRDLLLIGDDSGSIGWPNFDKIKDNFKAIARNIRGGIGSQETQLAMTTFATFTRQIFDFDDHHDVDDLVAEVDKTYFRGGYRSRIGDALVDANAWLFQQSGGMRSFPNKDDNIEHEILIVTDGCRTSDMYKLKQGLKTIKKRGIKLYVLAVASRDVRCQETVKSMVDDEDNLFQLGGWDQMDEMNKRIEEKVCISERRGDSANEDDDFVLQP